MSNISSSFSSHPHNTGSAVFEQAITISGVGLAGLITKSTPTHRQIRHSVSRTSDWFSVYR